MHTAKFIVLAAILVACNALFNMKPTKTYERAMVAAVEAEEGLYKCRAEASGDHVADLECFEEAIALHAYNASWCKQLGALYTTLAMRKKALNVFNQSAYTILEANGFAGVPSAPKLPPAKILKLYYIREGERGVELGKVWAKATLMQHLDIQAAEMLDDFLAAALTSDLKELIDLYRDLGSIVDILKIKRLKFEERQAALASKGRAKRMPAKQMFLAHIAEEIPRLSHDMAARYLSVDVTASPGGKNETTVFNRDRCGMSLPFKEGYTFTEMVTFLGVCIAKWGEYKETIQKDGPPTPYGSLMRTALHTIAAFGNEFLIRHVVQQYPQLLDATDNFGWTPMHWAVAHNNAKSVRVLLKLGGAEQLKVNDAGDFTPLKIGCTNARFRLTMQSIANGALGVPNACEPYEIAERVHDDESEDDDDDEVVLGGHWKNAKHSPETSRCDFDVRNGESMSHHEVIGRYVHASRPVVLRDILPVSMRKSLQKNVMKSRFADVKVRQEEIPASQRYGGPESEIVPLKTWLKNTSKPFASIELKKKHRMAKDLYWVPERIVPVSDGYTAIDDSWPMVVMGRPEAHTNHVLRSHHEFFSLVHGVQEWALRPPDVAHTTKDAWRSNVTDATLVKCTIHSGDILIIPQMWSGAFRSIGESIGMRRRMVWK